MMTCLVRHAVYAAILSMAVVYLGVLGWVGSVDRRPDCCTLFHCVRIGGNQLRPQVAFGMALSFVTSTIIAWLATRYDWGRKSRY